MRRADRLFRIVRILRGGRLQTARMLAEKLEVSERTIYRDVSDLQTSGMPIEGEAGVGYTLRRDLDLPPLMFTRSELTALALGARLVQAWGGTESMGAAAQALQRIEGVLPPDLRERLDSILMYAAGDRRCLYARRGRAEPARGTATGALLLEWRVDAGFVVRAAAGLPR